MNIKDLLNINSTTRQPRTNILHDRIQHSLSVELITNESIIVDPINSSPFLAAIRTNEINVITSFCKYPNGRYANVMFDSNGNGYRINQLKKADYFGGSGASRSCAKSTALHESATAIAIAYAISTDKHIVPDDLVDVNKVQQVTDDMCIGITDFNKTVRVYRDESWAISCCNTANIIKDRFDVSGMKIHRDSDWTDKFKKLFLSVNTDKNGRFFGNINKFNPSDLWFVRDEIQLPNSFDNITEMKDWLVRQYDANNVIGISLKKTPSTPTIATYNHQAHSYDMVVPQPSYKVASALNVVSSKTSFIVCGDAFKMELRAFNHGANISGEIIGKHAAGGKIAYGQINRHLSDMGVPTVTHVKELNMLSDEQLFNEILIFTNPINLKATTSTKTEIKSANVGRQKLISKYQSTQLVNILHSLSKSKQQTFVKKAIAYASSTSEHSSVFAKVWAA